MWKEGVTRVQYDRPFDVADFVIVPGEVTGEAPHDQGEVSYVGPVSQASQLEILNSEAAKQALGLDKDKQYALIQVGSAQLDGQSAVSASIDCLNALNSELTPVVLVSPVADREPEIPGAVVVHGRYPLAPYLKAFEFAVCSAGYNSVHENLAVGLPAVYVPNTDAVTDDQTARAELVAESGLGLVARSVSELNIEMSNMVSLDRRTALIAALAARQVVDGSNDTIMELLQIMDETRIESLHPDGTNDHSIGS